MSKQMTTELQESYRKKWMGTASERDNANVLIHTLEENGGWMHRDEIIDETAFTAKEIRDARAATGGKVISSPKGFKLAALVTVGEARGSWNRYSKQCRAAAKTANEAWEIFQQKQREEDAQ